MTDPARAQTPAPKAAAGGKIVPIVMMVNTVLVGGVLVFVAMRRQVPVTVMSPAAASPGSEGVAAETERADQPGPMYKLDQFVIQLKAVDAERYVRVAFDLELRKEDDKDAITQRMSQIRDSVISYFSDRTLDELRGSDGMENVKRALRKRLDGLVPGKRIRAVYITDFIIQ